MIHHRINSFESLPKKEEEEMQIWHVWRAQKVIQVIGAEKQHLFCQEMAV